MLLVAALSIVTTLAGAEAPAHVSVQTCPDGSVIPSDQDCPSPPLPNSDAPPDELFDSTVFPGHPLEIRHSMTIPEAERAIGVRLSPDASSSGEAAHVDTFIALGGRPFDVDLFFRVEQLDARTAEDQHRTVPRPGGPRLLTATYQSRRAVSCAGLIARITNAVGRPPTMVERKDILFVNGLPHDRDFHRYVGYAEWTSALGFETVHVERYEGDRCYRVRMTDQHNLSD